MCINKQNPLFCTTVTHSVLLCYMAIWSLQMGPKTTLGTLTMSGDDFPGVWGVLRGSNSFHDLIRDVVIDSQLPSLISIYIGLFDIHIGI